MLHPKQAPSLLALSATSGRRATGAGKKKASPCEPCRQGKAEAEDGFPRLYGLAA